MSFELHGRDEDGVFAFSGLDPAPSLAGWLAVLAVALCFLAAVLIGGVEAAIHGRTGLVAASLVVSGLTGRMFVGGAVWWLRVRRRLAGLSSLADLSSRTGVTEDDLVRAAKESSVMPIYRVNRIDLYDTAQFNASLLVRPSEPAQALLRPAPVCSQPNNNLLTPSCDRDA